MLVQVMSDHMRRRPFLAWLLAARYHRLLRDFIDNVTALNRWESAVVARLDAPH